MEMDLLGWEDTPQRTLFMELQRAVANPRDTVLLIPKEDTELTKRSTRDVWCLSFLAVPEGPPQMY